MINKKRINKVVQKEYGKVIETTYDVEEYKKDIAGFIACLCFPIIGWFVLYMERDNSPLKYNWRYIKHFDSLEQARYFINNGKREEWETETIKGSS